MGSLLDTIEAQQEAVTQNLKLEARKETVEASRTGPLSVLQSTSRSAQLNAFDRLFHIACEQQFIDLLSVPDAHGRTTLHYAASARGVMVDFLLSYRKKRFLQASTGEGLHRVPLFPAGGFVHPGTGDLWLPGDYAAAVGMTGGGSSTLGVDAMLGGGGADDAAAAAPGGFVPVSALVRARTDPAFTDARDAYGGTPLMYATVASDVRSIRSLLEHGADGFAATPEGLTPLDLSSNRIVRASLIPMEAAVQSACGVNAPRAGVRTPARGAAAALLSTTAATIASGSSSAGAGAGLGAASLSASASLTIGVSGGGVASVRRGGLGSAAASSALRSPGGFPTSGALSSSGLGGSGGRRGSVGLGATEETGGGDGDARRLRAESSLMLLVNSGEDINGRSGIHMRAPLHIAVENGALEVVELLLNNGAVVDICDVNGATPLHLAAEAGSFVHQEIVRLLCDAGAAVNATSSLRKSPLHFAATGATGGSAAARERAAAAGPVLPSGTAGAEAAAAGADAQPSLPASRPASPSDKPTAAGRRSRADSLGGALGATHGAGASPYAVEDGGSGMVALLVSLGANIDAVDAEGNTALIAAAKRGNTQTVDTLLTLGARLYAQNSHGMTALHVATFNHHIPVVRQLARWDAEFGRLKFVLDTSGRSAYDVGADSATRAALHTLFEACASGRLDLAQSVASHAAALPPGAAAPWLPLRATDVTRVLRRSCLHVTVTGAARALARWRAEGGVSPTAAGAAATGAAAGGASANGMGSPSRKGSGSSGGAAPPSPARSGRTPKPAASAVHTVAGIGLRFSAHKGWAAGAPQPPPAARMAWGASPADVTLAFYEPPDPETTTLAVDPYAFCAPPERAAVPAAAAAEGAPGSSSGGGGGRRLSSAAFPSAASGGSSAATSLAARRLVPGSELTSPQVEKEFGRVLEFLLRSGCPVDAADIDGVTAAMLAARYGLLYLLRKLLARGASPAAADRAGNTALHYAYAFGHVTAAGIVEEACSEEVAGARNAAGRSALEVAAAGLRILPDSSEQLLIIRPPPRRSSTLAVSAAV